MDMFSHALLSYQLFQKVVSACIELLPARVLQLETLRALTIVLEREGAMEEI